MQVTFELTPEDLWQWNLYYRSNRHSVRPAFLAAWIATLGLMIALLLLIFGVSLLHHHPVSWAQFLYLPGLVWLAYRFMPPSRKRVTKQYARDPAQFCSHTIMISPAWIEETTPLSQNKMAWSRLTSIEENAKYLYLCVKSRGAHVIPKRAFSSPHEADLFLNTARQYWEAAESTQPVPDDDADIWPPPPRIGA